MSYSSVAHSVHIVCGRLRYATHLTHGHASVTVQIERNKTKKEVVNMKKLKSLELKILSAILYLNCKIGCKLNRTVNNLEYELHSQDKLPF